MKLPRCLSNSALLLFLLSLTLSFSVVEPPRKLNLQSQSVNIIISGTSSLHDWEMKSDKGRYDVVLAFDNRNKITGISAVNFDMPAESLKSGHSLMDNNTYKALKTANYKTINFTFSSARIMYLDATTCQLNISGKLSIAGSTKETDLVVILKYNASDNSFTVSGKKDIKMTDYNVKPPTVMLGTIKTGNDISIAFYSRIAL